MVFMKAALLIEASNVKGHLHIPGAKKDVENWQMYLGSDIGGLWSKIETRSKPRKKEVLDYLNQLSFFHQYVFVAFSGHGYHDPKKNRTVILLNDDEEMDVAELQPAVNSTLVVDACRGVEAATVGTGRLVRAANLVALSESATRMQKSAVTRPSPEAYARLFDSTVQKYTGNTVMYSCSVGEAADEDPNNGGVYTTALIRSSLAWHEGAQSTPSVLSSYHAHQAAKEVLVNQKADQKPEYKFTGTALNFPLAVKP